MTPALAAARVELVHELTGEIILSHLDDLMERGCHRFTAAARRGTAVAKAEADLTAMLLDRLSEARAAVRAAIPSIAARHAERRADELAEEAGLLAEDALEMLA